ncbi:hypothetical protein [Phenylobacterium sp.]|jgi:hypothetical protein|uniref:hypothetical protein n=1 Tax=Phenylobacterium sp. TaxID=1871053 RepID=UPI000C8A1549|nr:hypothetical protein [Phenylobacterium sp.]MAK80336.1 hypothetical protein [Phenylobacterium sp.]|tara:strand:+ start:3147 stop:3701 length:555 start_codon:yes stop_codon:yes gene_type:complete
MGRGEAIETSALMNPSWMGRAAFAATMLVCALVSGPPATAKDLRTLSAAPFDQIAGLIGEWRVKEAASLRIVFESTAGGGVMVERWMLGERTHSLTIYHRDGDRLLATHYCPQGNQPRLAAAAAVHGELRFALLDVTDLDPGESYQHDLAFKRNPDGSISRSEIYWGPDGAGEESIFTLFAAAR